MRRARLRLPGQATAGAGVGVSGRRTGRERQAESREASAAAVGYRRAAWVAGVGLGAVTIPVTVVAGLLGPLALAICAVALGVPVWLAWWWLAWRG